MELFKVVAHPSGGKRGICYADSFPVGWEEHSKRGTFEECSEFLKCVERRVDGHLPSEWLAENYYTKQIILVITSYAYEDHDGLGWSYQRVGEKSAHDCVEQWRQEYGNGLTHVVILRDGTLDGGGDAGNFQAFPLTGPIPEGWHFNSFAGTEEECREEISKWVAGHDPHPFRDGISF